LPSLLAWRPRAYQTDSRCQGPPSASAARRLRRPWQRDPVGL